MGSARLVQIKVECFTQREKVRVTNLSVNHVDNAILIGSGKTRLRTLAAHIGIYSLYGISLWGAAEAQSTDDGKVGSAPKDLLHHVHFVGAAFLGGQEALEIVLDANRVGSTLVPGRRVARAHEVGDDGIRVDIAGALGPTERTILARVDFVVTDDASVSLSAARIDDAVARGAVSNCWESFVSYTESFRKGDE